MGHDEVAVHWLVQLPESGTQWPSGSEQLWPAGHCALSVQVELQNVMPRLGPLVKRRQRPALHSPPVWQKRHWSGAPTCGRHALPMFAASQV